MFSERPQITPKSFQIYANIYLTVSVLCSQPWDHEPCCCRPIIGLVSQSVPEVATEAIRALCNLARSGRRWMFSLAVLARFWYCWIACLDAAEENTASLVQDGAIPAIIGLLKGKDPGLHGLALSALMNLSQVGEFCLKEVHSTSARFADAWWC